MTPEQVREFVLAIPPGQLQTSILIELLAAQQTMLSLLIELMEQHPDCPADLTERALQMKASHMSSIFDNIYAHYGKLGTSFPGITTTS